MKLNHILPGTISLILAARPFVICIDPCQTGLTVDFFCVNSNLPEQIWVNSVCSGSAIKNLKVYE